VSGRRRSAGYYVAVQAPVAPGLPSELLDGPWESLEAAQKKAAQIEQLQADKFSKSPSAQKASATVVFIGEDGLTIDRNPSGNP